MEVDRAHKTCKKAKNRTRQGMIYVNLSINGTKMSDNRKEVDEEVIKGVYEEPTEQVYIITGRKHNYDHIKLMNVFEDVFVDVNPELTKFVVWNRKTGLEIAAAKYAMKKSISVHTFSPSYNGEYVIGRLFAINKVLNDYPNATILNFCAHDGHISYLAEYAAIAGFRLVIKLLDEECFDD